MKFLLLLPAVRAGGAERVMAILAGGLADRGHDVALATLSPGEDFYPLDDRRVRRIRLDLAAAGRSPLSPVRNFLRRHRALRALLRAERPDAAVSFMNRLNVRVLLSARGLGIPIIVSERIAPERTGAGPLWRALRRLAYPAAALLVAQTEREAAWFRRFVPRAAVIPNPVPDAAFAYGYPSGEPAPAGDPGAPRLAAMGRLERQKGFDILVRAFSSVRSEFPRCTLTIYGEGSQRRRLERLARRSGLSDAVRLPGTTSEPYAALARADAFVLSSRAEGFPNVLAEAMAVGTPVVAFDCPNGPRELVSPDITGKLVPGRSPRALADAVIDILGDRRKRELFAETARESIRDRCGLDSVLDAWEAAIASALPVGKEGPA